MPVRVFFLLALCVMTASAQTRISGVINTYAQVLSMDYCLNTATVGSSAGFAVGDSVLIIQMTGATIDESNTPTFGKLINDNGVGSMEFARIESVPNGTTLRFSNALLNRKYLTPYTIPVGATQIIKVPVYSTAEITAKLTSPPWNGQTGGVLVLLATGSITMNASIDVSGMGFAGGQIQGSTGSAVPNILDYSLPDDGKLAGLKGDGIAGNLQPNIAARGPASNGGGGGNADNAGGGGGASFGATGGQGGDQTNTPGYGRRSNGGLGGRSDIPNNGLLHLIMGGGGGSGHQNDGQGTPGGNGGGIVIILTPSLTTNGNAIIANGSSATSSKQDGAGAGGAGGAVYLLGATGAAVTVIANGGNGGFVDAASTGYAFGPGGGGAGGAVWCGTPAVTITANGGTSGVVTNSGDPVIDNTSYGAQPGVSNNAPYAVIPIPASKVHYDYLFADSHLVTMCAGDSVTISASNGDSYLWKPAAAFKDPTNGKQIVSPVTSSAYTVEITKAGCTFPPDTVHVDVSPRPNASFTGPNAACESSTVNYSIPLDPGTVYQWMVTGGTPKTSTTGSSLDVTWDSAGFDTVMLMATKGACPSYDTMIVSVGMQVTPVITGADTICAGTTTTLIAPAGFASYLWSPGGETTDSIVVSAPGSYTVTVTSAGGCTGTSAPMNVVVHANPSPTITATDTVLQNKGDTIVLRVARGYSVYLWSTKDTTASIIVIDSGTYTAQVIDTNGCGGQASILVVLAAPVASMELAMDSIQAAPGEHVTLHITIANSLNVGPLSATDFEYTLSFDKSLLVPADPAIAATSTYKDNWRTITIPGSRTGTTGLLSQVEFIAALGSKVSSPIYLDKITWTAPDPKNDIHTRFDSSMFTLLGVCPAGGNRLYSDSGTVLLNAVRPNPIRDGATIDYSLVEDGLTELFVQDMLGRTVQTLMSGDALPGEYHRDINVLRLSNGIYRLVLHTPTQIFTQKMEVYH